MNKEDRMDKIKIPDTIYLQWDDPSDDEGVTWCQDSINNEDIRYLRADQIEVKNKKLRDALKRIIKCMPLHVIGTPQYVTIAQEALKNE